MRNSRKTLSLVALSVITALGASFAPASAATYLLTDDGCGCGLSNYGTITVTNSASFVDVLVSLASGVYFNAAGGSAQHNSLSFDPSDTNAAHITGLTAKNSSNVLLASGVFVPGNSSTAQSPYGVFSEDIDWVGPPTNNGTLSSLAHTLEFDLPTGTTFGSTGGFYFTADILNAATGGTGNVGAVLSAVPEPATWAMFLIGFGGIGFMTRTRRKGAVASA
jgi:hypothetical protein